MANADSISKTDFHGQEPISSYDILKVLDISRNFTLQSAKMIFSALSGITTIFIRRLYQIKTNRIYKITASSKFGCLNRILKLIRLEQPNFKVAAIESILLVLVR